MGRRERAAARLIGLVEDLRPRDCEALLAAGFDDAVGAPVSPRELAGCVRALHRRVHWRGAPSGRLRFGGLTLDLHGRALWAEGRTIRRRRRSWAWCAS